ncbi:PaaI family thioesterase [Camelimonas abortus]|uniref:PaaI family thioesterase n=1 Tax=Camelimonas abortus TaxID=1017184 RepID=A0ABV7LDN1_9HYPH
MSDDAPETTRGARPEAARAEPPAARLLGRTVIAFDPAAGEGAFTYVAGPGFCNRHGTVQGGLLAAMLDSATGFTFIESLGPGLTAVTRELRAQYHRPARPGVIHARARVVRNDGRDGEVHGELRDAGGQLLASAVALMRVLRR